MCCDGDQLLKQEKEFLCECCVFIDTVARGMPGNNLIDFDADWNVLADQLKIINETIRLMYEYPEYFVAH